jgi:transcriptional antiterminator RfaH
MPLFPGYICIHGDSQERVAALETNLVARVLPVEDQAQLHADLARVYHLMTSGMPLTPEERLNSGAWVEITSGPLVGLQGRILRRGSRLRYYVEVQFFQRGVSVEIESWMIKALDNQRPATPVVA